MKNILVVSLMAIFLAGCPASHQTITEQMVDQQADPATISLAVYADALQVYVDSQELYLPYQQTMRETDPELDAKIIGEFQKARKVLDRWRVLGDVTPDDKDSFRDAIRKISLEVAKTMEEN